jgi:hypothetical protein
MTDTNEPRLCKDCRWYFGFNNRASCTFHREFDLVRGSKSVSASPYRERRAWVLFETEDRCKPEGKNWEPRPPMPPPPPAHQD